MGECARAAGKRSPVLKGRPAGADDHGVRRPGAGWWRFALPALTALGALAVVLAGAGPVPQAVAAVAPGVLAVGAVAAGLPRRPRSHRPPWVLHGLGLACVTAGHVLFHVALHQGGAWSGSAADVLFVLGNALVLTALARLSWRRFDSGALLDTAIAATGAAVAIGALVVRPALAQTGLSGTGAVLVVVYPLFDLLLLGLALHWLLSGRSARVPSVLAAAAYACLLAGDVLSGAVVLLGPELGGPWQLLPFSWCLSLLAAAALTSTRLAPAVPDETTTGWPLWRWLLVGGAACLAPAVLLGQGLAGLPVDWAVVGTGSLVLSALTLARVRQLVRRVEEQARQLAEVARTDALTGLPNRRTWDACLQRALAGGGPVAVALLDLDHFKRLNDTAGHAAGDRVLRSAAGAWRDLLPPAAMIARYGGEEFAVLLTGAAVPDALDLVEDLRRATPAPQTASAGVARWDGAESAAELVARADAALYAAKRGGRDRVAAR